METRPEGLGGFVPPFCPNPKCPYHKDLTHQWRWKRSGSHRRLSPPHLVPRFTCLRCQRSFSSQTFSTTYYLKRPELPALVFMKATGGMANRQIARDLGVAPSAIDRQVARLGRHCLLLHRKLAGQARPEGPLVLDSFESFEYSQYFPFQHHVLVEAQTSFFWHFTDSPLRRKGRMTAEQKRRREELEGRLGKPRPRTVEGDVRELLEVGFERLAEVTLRSDDHKGYPRAFGSLACRVTHEVTSSRARRDTGNPLFEINLLDLLIRHSQANHRRETLAWSKRRQGSAERLAVLLVWRNYMKRRWEKRCRETPAMLKGLLDKPLRVAEVLAERLFHSRIELPARWAQYYAREVVTRALERNAKHELKFAF